MPTPALVLDRVPSSAPAAPHADGIAPVLQVPRRTVMSVLTVAAFGLVLMSYAQDLLSLVLGEGVPHIWRLDVDAETSVPTWFSSALILVNALLLGLVATIETQCRGVWRWHWWLLAAVFVALSMDEAASLHEALSAALSGIVRAGGVFHFAWVLPALVLCAMGFFAYLPFIGALESTQRARLLVAAGVFLAGAVGTEMVAGAHVESYGMASLTYRTLTTLEEALELLGMLLMLNFLMCQLGGRVDAVRLRVV